jgi:hypothetical protein
VVSGAVRWCVGCGCVGAGRAVPRAPERRARRPPPSRRRDGASDRSCVVPGHQLTLGRSCCDRKPRHDTSRRGGRLPPGGTTCQRGVTVGPRQGRGEQRAQPTTTRAHAPPSGTLIRGAGLFRDAAPPGGSRPPAEGAVSGFPIAARPPMGTQKAEDDTAAIGCPVAAPTRHHTAGASFRGARNGAISPRRPQVDRQPPPTPRGAGNCATSPHRARAHPRPDRTTP